MVNLPNKLLITFGDVNRSAFCLRNILLGVLFDSAELDIWKIRYWAWNGWLFDGCVRNGG